MVKRNFQPFEDARRFVHSLRLKSGKEWVVYCKSSKKPDDIPAHPWDVYKNRGWISMGDWLGTGRIADQLKQYRPFKEAREFVRTLDFQNSKEWSTYCKSGKKPDDIPKTPWITYKNNGWTSWGDWLGTGRIAPQNMQFRTFEEAREFVRSLGLKTIGEWRKYCKSGKKPVDIPADPWKTYKEWKKPRK